MKHLSRILSLALVVALSLSLVVVAGAIDEYKKFTDYSQIEDEYIEAVDVLTALEVLAGYEDGSFQPKREVKRAEAAKLVAYISLGATQAERLSANTSRFTDVLTGGYSWANKYIEFAAERGIINGVGNGRFNPGGDVTGAQFAKLMLTALGYGAKNEYIGDSWALNSIIDGQRHGILTIDADYSAPATREQVALYLFNTINPINPTGRNYLVKFSTIINDYVLANADNIGVAIGNTGSQQYLGPETFGLLVRSGIDAYGYAGHNWALAVNPNKHVTGFYQTDVVLGESSMAGIPLGVLADRYSPAYIAPLSAQVAYYVNGVRIGAVNPAGTAWNIPSYTLDNDGELEADVTATSNGYFMANGVLLYTENAVALTTGTDPYTVDATRALIRPGVIVTFVDSGIDRRWDFPGGRTDFYAFDGAADAVIIVDKTVHDVAGTPIIAANGDVRIPGVVPDALHADQIDYPANLAVNDVVLKHMDGFRVTHIEKAESVTGKMTYINRTLATVTVEGGTYGDSGLVGANAPLFERTVGYAHDATYLSLLTTLYLDNGGNVVRAIPAEPVVPPTYGFVLGFDYQGGTAVGRITWVRLLDNTNTVRVLQVATRADGITPDIDLGADDAWARNYLANGSRPQQNDVFIPVHYTMKDNNLVAIEALPAVGTVNQNYEAGKVIVNVTGIAGLTLGSYYITSDTALLYSNGTTEASTKVLKGYAAATAANIGINVSGVVVPGTRNLSAVYFNLAAPTVVPTHYFFLADGRVDVTKVENATTTSYEYIVWIDGVETRITTRLWDLLDRDTVIEDATTGLWVYDGNNDDVKLADIRPGADYYGVVDYVNTSNGVITYLGSSAVGMGTVCTSTTKYYEVTYGPFGGVIAGTINPASVYNGGVVYTIEGVELNNDLSAKAVYFTAAYGGITAWMNNIITNADTFNGTLNGGAGIAEIASLSTAAKAARDNPLVTVANRILAAVNLRTAERTYNDGLEAAKLLYTTEDATIKAEGSTTQTAINTMIVDKINGAGGSAIPYLYDDDSDGPADDAFNWTDTTHVTIKFADTSTVTWTMDNTHS
jgi:hypothetical protein